MGTSTHASGTAKNPILIIAGGVKMPEERSPSHILTKIRSADPATPLPPINKPKETFVPPVPPTEGAKPLDKTIISLLEIYAASNETSKLLEEQCKAVYKSSKQRRKTHKLAKRRKIDRDAEATTSKSTHGHRHQH
ncbi:hypothetical protein BGX29_007764 [Mortierella sp. GBA35]|nr:hypothetical protein BGX29_007764 [Mortierella sp. GBA35]